MIGRCPIGKGLSRAAYVKSQEAAIGYLTLEDSRCECQLGVGDNFLLPADVIEPAAVRSNPALPHDLSPALSFTRD